MRDSDSSAPSAIAGATRWLRRWGRRTAALTQEGDPPVSTFLADQAENLTVEGPSATFTYRRMGPHGGVPLVLMNRFKGTIDWWDPKFLDILSAEHDVIVFDYVAIGYTTGEARSSIEAFADGAIEFIEALGLPQVDLLGWSLGGNVAQHVVLRRPDLVRKLVIGGNTPGGTIPGAPETDARVFEIMVKEEPDEADILYLFYPDTEAGRASGREHLANVMTRMKAGSPSVSDEAAAGLVKVVEGIISTPIDQVKANLESIKHPVLYANGMQDVMVPALGSFLAAQHLDSAKLVIYSDAGHAFLFQHAEEFVTEVANFLAS
jgi:pimeloyl-ACP methyl ester carboxylesterase